MIPEIRKTPRGIILQKCTKNHDHMLYCSTDLVRDSCNFYFSFWVLDYFLFFCPPNSPKNQNLKKRKEHLEILSFYTCVPKIMMVPDI